MAVTSPVETAVSTCTSLSFNVLEHFSELAHMRGIDLIWFSMLHKDCLSNIGQNKHFDSPKLNISMESLRRTRFFATVSVELEDDTVREVSNNFWFIFTASWSFYALYSKTQFLWYGALCSLNIGRRFTWSFSDFFSSVWQPNFSKENSPIFPISGSCLDSKRWLPPVSFPHKASALTS